MASLWTRANVWLDRRIGLHGGYYALQHDLNKLQEELDEIKAELEAMDGGDE